MSEKTENKGESGESSDSESASLSSDNEQASDLSDTEVESAPDETANESKGDSEAVSADGENLSDSDSKEAEETKAESDSEPTEAATEVESAPDETANESKGDSEVSSTAGNDLPDSDSKMVKETKAESDSETAEVDALAADTAESDSESTEAETAITDQPETESVDSEKTTAKNKSADKAKKSKSPRSPKSSKTDSAVQNEETGAEPKPKKISVPKRGTFSGRNEDVERKWILIDAEGIVVGRLASFIAYRLRGKHKPEFTPHVDDGDYVVVVNADKVVLTGQKYTDKKYYWHTGYPGGIKERTAKAIMEGRFPERVLEKAVKRMLPSGPLAHMQYTNLRVYAGPDHPHKAQNPEVIEFGNMNPKNRLRA